MPSPWGCTLSQPGLSALPSLRLLHNEGPLHPHCTLLFSSSFTPISMYCQHRWSAPTGLCCPVSPLEWESSSTLLSPSLWQHSFSPQNQVPSTQLHSLVQNFAGTHHRYTIAVQLQEKMWLIFLRPSTRQQSPFVFREPTLLCLHSGMELLQQTVTPAGSTAWCSPSTTEAASGLASSPYLCQPLPSISPLHPSQQLQMLIPLLPICPPAQPQMYRNIFTVTVACYRLQCLPHKSQQQHSRAINDNGSHFIRCLPV